MRWRSNAISRRCRTAPGSAADYATAMYVKQRLERDGFTTRVQEYEVEFTGPLSQSLTMLSPRHVNFDMLEGTPGHHTKWELMAGPPFLEESGDGDVTGPGRLRQYRIEGRPHRNRRAAR